MKKLVLGLAVLCLLKTLPVYAQVNGVNVKLDSSQSGNVTGSPAECVKPQANIQTLFMFNNGADTIWYRSEDGTEPSASAAGSTPIASGTGWWWSNGSAPRNGLHCISSGDTDALTTITGQ